MEGQTAPTQSSISPASAPGLSSGSSPASSPQGETPTKPSSNPSGLEKGESKPVAQALPELFDVKVNGKTIRMTKQEALNHASMAYSANEKWNEAAKMRKETEAWKEKTKRDFISALQDPALGLTREQIRDEFEKWYHREFIEPETLTQEQRKLKEYEAKIKKYEEEEKTKKLQAEQEEEARLTNHQRQFLQQQIIEAMDASNFPKEPFFVQRMAFYMRQNLLNGWQAPKEIIIQQVRNEGQKIFRGLTANATIEQIIEIVGEDFVNKIRKHDLEKLRARRGQLQQPATSSRPGTGIAFNQERLSSMDVDQRLRDIRLGRI